ncbi:unnamed protein product [Dibothriocephalus latus]|uniref:Reverse transcriptase RNase H-like domain-containing protein n=1 Tax=Dibothriocephalus latus TaxID=60516 RepID=A0A3P7N295_DIBLA|nr:unnamed protein product [Dibothriocephalus latus]
MFAKKFHHYLTGKQFKMDTDHQALRWMENFQDPTVQLAHSQSGLSEDSYMVAHSAGKKRRMQMPCLIRHKGHRR